MDKAFLREFLEDAFMQAPSGIAIFSVPDYIITAANPLYRRIVNRTEEDLLGRPLFAAVPELTNVLEPGFQQVLATGKPYFGKEIEIDLHYPGKIEKTYFNFAYQPIADAEGSISAITVVATEVTGLVKAQHRLQESEEKFRTIVAQTPISMAMLRGPEWVIELANESILKNIWCRKLHQVIGKKLMDVFPELQGQPFPALLRKVFTTGEKYSDKEMAVYIEGAPCSHLDFEYSPFVDQDGSVSAIIVTAYDVSEKVKEKRKSQENEEKFRLLADSMPQFIWTGDVNGNLNYFNKSVYDYTGFTFSELEGQGWIQIVHPEDRTANVKKWREAIKKGGDFLFEHRFRRSDGVYRWQLSRAIPQYDSHGNIRMWVGTSTDIHDQKAFAKELEEKVFERTRELKETNEVLEKANRELEQFAYIASHDLQEPLRKIQTFSDMLKRNIHDEISAKKYFSKIDSSAQRMGDLIKSVLDYSRLPAHPGQLMLTDLNEIFHNVKTDLELMILEKGAIVESDSLPAVPGMPLQLHQLFSNLIGNSLKFCRKEPCIRIAARPLFGEELMGTFKADPYKRYLELIFNDNGIGFENKYKDQIFTIFQRLHGLQQYSGTGIGLALCKKIVENHQGYITAESEVGTGSSFRVYLPA